MSIKVLKKRSFSSSGIGANLEERSLIGASGKNFERFAASGHQCIWAKLERVRWLKG